MSTKISKWPAGTPMWIDLSVDDVEEALAFYTNLFGWSYLTDNEEASGYLLAQLGGHAVAGIGPKQDPGMPTVWTTYFASDDADESARLVKAAGGQLQAPPFDVMDSGRMAIAVDSVGATFGIWQAGNHIGAERVNEHGSLCWNELHTRDSAKAKAFYTEVFGYAYNDLDADPMDYSTCLRFPDGREVAGLQHDPLLPEGMPDYWLTWFTSDDVVGTALDAQHLGANLIMPVTDTPFGRMTIIQGLQGEVFGVIAVAPAND